MNVPRRFRSAVAAAALVALAAAAPAGAQTQPPFTVAPGGAVEQWRPLVTASGILADRALADALDSGLPLRIRMRIELWRRDVPEHLAGVHEVARAVTRNALGPGYVVEDGRAQREVPTLAAVEAALRTAFDVPVRPEGPGSYYYVGTLEVQTLSASDVDALRRWLRGEAAPAADEPQTLGRAVERGLQRVFVRLLRLPARRYAARTEVFLVR